MESESSLDCFIKRRKRRLHDGFGSGHSTADGKWCSGNELWGINEAFTFIRGEYDYFAVWTFPNMETAQNFEKLVEGAGWYNYFDQVNVMGNAGSPQDVID